jgi:hypothetical protein
MGSNNTGVEYELSLKDLFTSKINKSIASTEKLNNSVSKIQSTLGNVAGAFGIGLGVQGLVSFGKEIVDSLSNYEYFSASLRTLMKGDEGAAKALQGQLISLAAKTPFSLVEIQDATKQLLAYGFAGGEVTKNISMLGDVASGLKIPFQDIAYLYGTLKVQGRAFQRDILQFTQRGIPIVEELAKQFHVSKSEISQMVTAGKIGFPEVEKAFQSMTKEGGTFFNMMDAQSKTVGGQISNLGDNWEQLKVNIGKSQTGIIHSTVDFMNSMVASINRGIVAMDLLTESFKKTGTQDFSFYQKYVTPIMLKSPRLLPGGSFLPEIKNPEGGFKDLQQYAASMKDNFVDKNKSIGESLNSNKKLWGIINGMYKEDGVKNERYISVLKNLIDKNTDNISLFGKKGEVSEPTEAKTKASKPGTSLDAVEARGHQNFNIEIKSLVEHLEFHTTNLKESTSIAKEETIKTLVAALNDFQLMASK